MTGPSQDNSHLNQSRSSLDPRFASTVFVVEATDFEHGRLWEEFTDNGQGTWSDDTRVLPITLGELGGRPVVVNFRWSTINDQSVMFYNATSELVDHKMVREWLEANCNPMTSDGRRAHCDATNFYQCTHALSAASNELVMPGKGALFEPNPREQ